MLFLVTLHRQCDQEISKCREAGISWKNFIDNENFPWNRIVVQKYSCQSGETALHLAAETGQIGIYKSIFQDHVDKNPKNKFGDTPLHFAAGNGHLEICQLIVENVEDKNPKNELGETPLFLATMNWEIPHFF